VVAWTAYDAPSLLHVASAASARAGGRLLAADLRALEAARGTPPHLTAIGHSYGSTTVGLTVRDHPTGVDDVVLLGSPGAGVERAGELGLPAGHVWVGSASRDPVGYLDRFGADPAHADFGGVRFRAEDLARHPAALDLADHSRYLAAGGESLDNVVQVVVGDGADVHRAAYRGELPWAPDGISLDPEADRRPQEVP
jgi:pimeloyl-ACP methyl ester carboxylesterase